MERCTGHKLKVFDSSGKQRLVFLDENGIPKCTCASFVMKDMVSETNVEILPWCKHIEAQYNRLCKWRGVSTIIPGKCPLCSKDTEEI